MEKQVLVIEYTGAEPSVEALENVITSLALAGTTICPKPEPELTILSEKESAQALYVFTKTKGISSKTVKAELKRNPNPEVKKAIEIIAKALENV